MLDHAPIHYRIAPLDLHAHLFEVRLTVTAQDSAGQRLRLPAWIPGSYLIRDFARHVVALEAESAGSPVAVEKVAKDVWQCAPVAGALTVVYHVYAYDLSVRGAYLDASRGYFNGACVFLAVEGREGEGCTVEIALPPGNAPRDWRVATSLQPAEVDASGFGSYRAADYDELIDHPVEMGDFAQVEFEACGVPHRVAIAGRQRADLARLARDLKPLCETHIRFFGEPAPFDRYLFLVMAVGEGYGGLEHRASTSLICKRDELPRPDMAEIGEDYRTFLGLASHEYFHAWQVKRIKPRAFTPYDLSKEAYTRQLWAFEGITSYYDDLLLQRSGLLSRESYLEQLGRSATRLYRTPGRLRQTVEESSFDAWIKFYRPDENTPNAVVSYYVKGSLLALALDLRLRLETNGACSLDSVMRALWERYGKKSAGVPEDGLETLTREISRLDLRDFFDSALRGTGELPLPELLPAFGIAFDVRPAESESDKGGKPAATPAKPRASLGIRLAPGNEAKLAHVLDGGAAQQAGLAAGDVIIAVDGLKAAGLEKMLERYEVGSRVRLHAFRRDELLEVEATLQAAPADTCVLRLMDDADDAAKARREAWLQGR